jgi:hypothetical protein
MHAYQHRSPGEKRNRHLIAGPLSEKAAFIRVSQADITYLNLCQTLKQAPHLHVYNTCPYSL